ncbi:MAG: hypothetical protein ACREBU_17950 [Nitrososphaera sp.]
MILLAAAAGTSASEKMRIGGNGNVGIGTANPLLPLQISKAGPYNHPAVGVMDGTTAWAYLFCDNAFHNSLIWDASRDMRFGTETGVGSGYIEWARITRAGNVGIGTSGPAAKLHSIAGNNGTGVRGEASGDGVGVYGQLNSATEFGLAGYFIGNSQVVGNLSKSSGSFQIDHPLDPANKYLLHSFVESPDMMNIYNGNVVLNDKGEAMIELPKWFEALNKDFRYQLTCIGGFAQVYIAEEISNNHFKIAGGKPGLKVSWQVTGIRHDPYAEKHRIPIEKEKRDFERGRYLHPEVYGQPKENSIALARYPESSQPPNKQ